MLVVSWKTPSVEEWRAAGQGCRRAVSPVSWFSERSEGPRKCQSPLHFLCIELASVGDFWGRGLNGPE